MQDDLFFIIMLFLSLFVSSIVWNGLFVCIRLVYNTYMHSFCDSRTICVFGFEIFSLGSMGGMVWGLRSDGLSTYFQCSRVLV